MRKKIEEKSQDSYINGIRIFRADFEEVLRMLRDNGYLVKLETKGYSYPDIEDVIEDHGCHPKDIKVKASKRSDIFYENLSVDFKNGDAFLHNYGDVDNNYYEIEKLLKRNSSVVKTIIRLVTGSLYFLSIWGVTLLLFSPKIFSSLGPQALFFVIVISSVLASIAYCVRLLLLKVVHSSCFGVWFIKQHEGGFWRRNRDQIMLSILTTTFGAILGIAGTLLIQWLSSK